MNVTVNYCKYIFIIYLNINRQLIFKYFCLYNIIFLLRKWLVEGACNVIWSASEPSDSATRTYPASWRHNKDFKWNVHIEIVSYFICGFSSSRCLRYNLKKGLPNDIFALSFTITNLYLWLWACYVPWLFDVKKCHIAN